MNRRLNPYIDSQSASSNTGGTGTRWTDENSTLCSPWLGLAQAHAHLPPRRLPRLLNALHLTRNGWVPNNDELPVLIYHGAFAPGGRGAFAQDGSKWPPPWRLCLSGMAGLRSGATVSTTFTTITPRHTTVLGFAGGWGRLVLGGEGGHELVSTLETSRCSPQAQDMPARCQPGLPCDRGISSGETWDICRKAPDAATFGADEEVSFPASDPVHGPGGPLGQY